MRMSQSAAGRNFEDRVLKIFSDAGYWTYAMSNGPRGQPFDLMAVRDGRCIAIEVKHLAQPIFYSSRVETNQAVAIKYYMRRGNGAFFIFGDEAEQYIWRADAVMAILDRQKGFDVRLPPGERLEDYLDEHGCRL